MTTIIIYKQIVVLGLVWISSKTFVICIFQE